VNIVLPVSGKVIVDNQGDLLDINASGQQISGDEDTRRARAELTHDDITLFLVHITMLWTRRNEKHD